MTKHYKVTVNGSVYDLSLIHILYESYVGSILATFALGATAGYGFNGMILPLAIAVAGIICSIIGSFLVRTKENASQSALLKSLRTGTYTAAVLSAIVSAVLCNLILTENQWGVFVAILCGLIGGCAIGYFTEYYTSDTYKPTQKLAAPSETGSATVNIGGLSLGRKSTLASILIVAVAVLEMCIRDRYVCTGESIIVRLY